MLQPQLQRIMHRLHLVIIILTKTI
ncbi:hypothetical protein NXF25_004809 [Crotalus adamanteus]|uniref:Uncharacterized protein n=1 Tax=Crotalus adamanteus TaxID=8729 RepID=A0AAW1BWD3_CROAD